MASAAQWLSLTSLNGAATAVPAQSKLIPMACESLFTVFIIISPKKKSTRIINTLQSSVNIFMIEGLNIV